MCSHHRSANSFFELEWRDGRVCVRAANGKYVVAKKNGQLAATVDSAGQWCFWTDEKSWEESRDGNWQVLSMM